MVAVEMSTVDSKIDGDDACWQAVLERDAGYDGAFVYAVTSTGIYCRPSCPSRKPLRENVDFFPLAEVAKQAGFRSCQRCTPDMQASDDPLVALARLVCIEIASGDGFPTLQELADKANVSPHHLQRSFKRVVGISPRQYADACRLGTLRGTLRTGAKVTDAMYGAGYGSSSRLYEQASSRLGMTPASYRNRGKGMKVSFTIVDCYLGKLLVAATERGICAVTLGDDAESLETGLRAEFRNAELTLDGKPLNEFVEGVLGLLSENRPNVNLPLDVQATAFERMVWDELRRIPVGETRSYSEVAEAIGRPKASRAVARACAANPTALVVPCHRVVRKDGSLGGYKWGIERKEKILAQEKGLQS